MEFRRLAALICLSLPLSPLSAVAAENKPPGVTENDAGIAYYVIGVAPDTAAPVLDAGHLADGKFNWESTFRPDHLPPVEGYVLGKVNSGSLLGIREVGFETPSPRSGGILGMLLIRPIAHSMGKKDYTDFKPCVRIPTMVFTPQLGHVLYITSLTFTYRDSGYTDKLQMRMANDIDRARAFLAKNYPSLAPRLEQGTYQTVPMNEDCPF